MKNIERFLKYISYDTTSNPYSDTTPSSKKELILAEFLVSELQHLGITNAFMDEFGYVYAYLKAKNETDKTIGLIAHMDTSFDASGENKA